MKLKEIGLIIYAFFLLIIIQIALMYLKEEISIITILEVGSFALIIFIYYCVVNTEVNIAAKKLEDRLMKIEKCFEVVEMKFNEEIKIFNKGISELKTLLKETSKKSIKKY